MSRRVKTSLTLPLSLLLGCVVLSWVIYADLVNPPQDVATQALKIPVSQALPGLTAQTKFSMPPIAHFRETVQRPLFSQSRRPPEVQAENKAAPPSPPPELTVLGIVFSPTERVAFVTPHGKRGRSKVKPLLQLSEGANYQGWTVVEIARKKVTLRQDDTEVSFALDFR